jgi:hypothetical protein
VDTVAAAAPPPVERVGAKPWGPREAGIAIALAVFFYFAIGLTAIGVAMAITGETDQEAAQLIAAGIVATIIFDGALVVITYAFSVQRFSLSWRALGLRPLAADLWWVPPAAAIGFIVANAAYSITMRALGADALATEQELNDLFQSRVLLPLTGVFTVFVAPVAEEIFFRGFLFPALIGKLRVWGAAIASGLLFGAIHIMSVDTIGLVIPLGAIGIALAFVYYRTGSLWATIATHFLINTISFILLASAAGSG